MKNSNSKKNFFHYDNPLWAFVIMLPFLLVFSWSTSPLYLSYGIDSPFFQIIGLGITQGKVPYVDLFDHKGPLIFFIDALGYSTGWGKTAIFFMQWISDSIAFIIFYRIARLMCSTPRRAFVACLLTLIPFADFIIEGNQCEEWMLPYIGLALLLVLKPVLQGREGEFQAWKSLVVGLCFAVVFYIRPNDGVMWIGGLYFGLFLLWIVRGNARAILPNVGAFILAFILVTAPIFAYFSSKDALDAWFYGMVIHNMKYASDVPFTAGGIGMIIIPLILVGAMLLLSRRSGRKQLWYLLLPVLVLVEIFIGKRDYYHYLIPFIPYVAMSFAMCLEKGWKLFLWVVCSLFAVFSYRQCTFIVKSVQIKGELRELYSQTDALFDLVPEEERNTIWNYNLTTYIDDGPLPHMYSLMGAFLHKGITPSSPVFAAFDLQFVDESYYVQAHEPRWLVMQPDDWYDRDFDYIYENYDLVASTPAEPVCEVRLYKRKEGR